MVDPFHWLLSSENFMPHGYCFLWQPFTLWLNAGSDALIAGSYFAIPAVIFVFTRRRLKGFGYSWVPLTFAAFIFLCGATHVMEIVTIWNPLYRVAGALKLVTGLVSLATAASLLWVLPKVLLLKTPAQLNAEVAARTRELNVANDALRAEVAARVDAERQLRLEAQERARADALLRTIVQSAPSPIYAKDRDGRMLLANPPALALIGKSWDEIKGRTDAEFLDDPSQGEAILRTDRRVMESDRTEETEEAVGSESGEPRIWYSIKAPFHDASGAVTGLVGVSVEMTERKRLEDRLRLMLNELNHRVKNTLAAVQAIAGQTLRSAHRDLYQAFQNRLLSLAAAHDVLTRESWAGADICDIALGQLGPFGASAGGRIEFAGPKFRMNSRAATALGMALHELATNALKYGALSNERGRVVLNWEVREDATPTLTLTWREVGGPDVVAPARRGFGSRMIEQNLARDLEAAVRLQFEPEGVTCVIEAPLQRIAAAPNMLAFPRVGSMLGTTG